MLLCIIGVFILLKRLYREQLKRQPVTRKMREIAIWQMTVSKINAYDGEEAKIVRKKLEEHIKNLVSIRPSSVSHLTPDQKGPHHTHPHTHTHQKNVVREGKAVGKGNLAEAEYVAEIEGKYVITNKPLLIKSGIVLLIVVFVFFLEAFVELHLSLAWTALIGAVVLLILADVRDINTVFEKVSPRARIHIDVKSADLCFLCLRSGGVGNVDLLRGPLCTFEGARGAGRRAVHRRPHRIADWPVP